MGYWASLDLCVACKTPLCSNTIFYNNATCPYCGYSVGGTVCLTVKESVYFFSMWEKLVAWWKKEPLVPPKPGNKRSV